ncbi:hypothetical protein [Bifidobacterium cebidarum]|uniref:hypothetical protein n=1 Tax=Bifidobacterium cebidarum TaxID=2650773 RepID=UPI0012644394|nr:hypothetical protein [Bifidobacterium cebidarum]
MKIVLLQSEAIIIYRQENLGVATFSMQATDNAAIVNYVSMVVSDICGLSIGEEVSGKRTRTKGMHHGN